MSKSGPPQYAPPSNYPPTVGPPPGGHVIVTTTYPPACCPVLGPHSQLVQCPSCHSTVATRVEAETSTKTHIIAAMLCLVSCCCIPYCIDSCKDRNHYCPNCNSFIGKHY